MNTHRKFVMYNIAVITLLKVILTASHTDAYENVLGTELQRCSYTGMALSGYTRTGYCVDQQDDEGSHHICIDLSSANGGNFCTVTGQSDWCSSSMECDDSGYYSQNVADEGNNEDDDASDDDDQTCPVQNWCVCQWAFANYLEAAGGCDAIQDVVCESINAEAVKAYIGKQNAAEKYSDALACIVERCGVDLTLYDNLDGTGFWSGAYRSLFGRSSSSASRSTALVVLVGVLGIGMAIFATRGDDRRNVKSMEQPILDEMDSHKNSGREGNSVLA